MTPAVSVVIPTRNRGASLGRSVDSVLAQTFTDFEVVIVNDQSTDDTGAVIAAYQAKDRRVKGIFGRREGSGAARNAGVKHAAGRYIAFLDDDDAWRPEKLAAQMQALEQAPETGLVFTEAAVVRAGAVLKPGAVPKGHPAFKRWLQEHRPRDPREAAVGRLDRVLWFVNPITLSTVLFRKDLFDAVGGFRQYRGGEGYDLWIRMARHAPFAFVDRVGADYEVGSATTMGPWESRAYRTREFDFNVLERNVAGVPEDLRPAVRARMAECARLAGWYWLRAGEREHARELLLRGLRYRWWQPRTAVYLALSWCPVPVLKPVGS